MRTNLSSNEIICILCSLTLFFLLNSGRLYFISVLLYLYETYGSLFLERIYNIKRPS